MMRRFGHCNCCAEKQERLEKIVSLTEELQTDFTFIRFSVTRLEAQLAEAKEVIEYYERNSFPVGMEEKARVFLAKHFPKGDK